MNNIFNGYEDHPLPGPIPNDYRPLPGETFAVDRSGKPYQPPASTFSYDDLFLADSNPGQSGWTTLRQGATSVFSKMWSVIAPLFFPASPPSPAPFPVNLGVRG